MIAYITELNNDNYEEFTKNGIVLIDIHTSWCGPCKLISPMVDKISSDYHGQITVGKLDADTNREIISELGVKNIPTLLIYKDGELVKNEDGSIDKLVGSVTKDKLVTFIDKYLN